MPEPTFLAFDIETVKHFPDGDDWRDHRPLGIACAAVYSEHLSTPTVTWSSSTPDGIADQMSTEDLHLMVAQLCNISSRGYTIVTWNGLGFDFDVLAEESGLHKACRDLALQHVDMMFHLFTNKGYPRPWPPQRTAWAPPGKPPAWTAPWRSRCGPKAAARKSWTTAPKT